MEQKEFFYWLMNKIDKWATDEEKNTGPLKFLQPLNTKQIVATHSYRTTIDQLKSYLLFDVMGLYEFKNSSKVNWSDVQEKIDGKNGKKYYFQWNNLNKYFDTEEIGNFLDQSKVVQKLLKEQPELKDLLEDEGLQEEWIPYLLLEDIQNASYHALGNYYAKYTTEDFSQEEEEVEKQLKEEEEKKKKIQVEEKKTKEEEEAIDKEDCIMKQFWKNTEKLHKEFLYAVALYEIFWLESYTDVIDNEISQATEELQQITEELQTLPSNMKSWGEKEEEFLKRAEQVMAKYKKLKLLGIKGELSKEFAIGLIAEQQILMMIELLWITIMPGSEWKIEEKLQSKIIEFLDADGMPFMIRASRKNYDREEAYKDSYEYIMGIFQKIEESGVNNIEWIKKAKPFLQELKKVVNGEQEVNSESMRKAQYQMVRWIFQEYKDIK